MKDIRDMTVKEHYEYLMMREAEMSSGRVARNKATLKLLEECAKVALEIEETKAEQKTVREKLALADHILSVKSCFDCQIVCMRRWFDPSTLCEKHYGERRLLKKSLRIDTDHNDYYTPKGNFPDDYTPYALRRDEAKLQAEFRKNENRLELRPGVTIPYFIARYGNLVRQRSHSTQDTICVGKGLRFKTIGEAVENMQARKIVQLLPEPKL